VTNQRARARRWRAWPLLAVLALAAGCGNGGVDAGAAVARLRVPVLLVAADAPRVQAAVRRFIDDHARG
jgi:hypothetical protein